MKDIDAGDIVFIIWIAVVVITVIYFVTFVASDGYSKIKLVHSSVDNRMQFCEENPCVCRCEAMGNGGLEECTYLCRGGY